MNPSCRTLVALVLALCLSACKERPVVKVVHPARKAVESTVTGVESGSIWAEQNAELAFGAVGRVQRLHVRLGDTVKAWEILAQLENEDLLVALQTLENDYDRRAAAYLKRAVAQSDLEAVKRQRDSARVAYEKTLIRAPFDGRVTELNLEVGQLSQITAVIPKPLIRLVDTRPRYARVEIDEVDLPRVKAELPARVKVLAVRKVPFAAKVRRVIQFVSSVREQDRTALCEIDIDAEGVDLPVGASADVEIVVETHDGVVAVPTKSILGRGENRYVMAVQGDVLAKKPVKVGLWNYERSEILEGISLEDRIVIPLEAVELQDGAAVRVEEQAWP